MFCGVPVQYQKSAIHYRELEVKHTIPYGTVSL
jgi:hypothetical protein